ncbi:MAG TPA: response regulator transcription factor [Blastocatellia bacterium]|jgi:DNA-binding NarL/FixJ family response regulator|nr:response regulator transcription factor [Blastocatellia bacterium]
MSLLNKSTIKTAVVEDQREIREGLGMLIDATEGYQCAGAYGSMEEALEGIDLNVPDIVLCDIGLPGMSGIEGIRILKERYPGLLLLTLSIYDDDERIFDALCAGACGYLLKRTSRARLLDGINEAVTGGTPISPEVASRVLALFRDVCPPGRGVHELTPEAMRLLELLVEGHNYPTAAEELNITHETVKLHMREIYHKLQALCKSEAVAPGPRERLFS